MSVIQSILFIIWVAFMSFAMGHLLGKSSVVSDAFQRGIELGKEMKEITQDLERLRKEAREEKQ